MKILFVEDNKNFLAQAEPLLASVPNVSRVDVAGSKASALQALDTEFYDLIILDLSIPPTDTSIEAVPEHGQSTFHEARRITPGTPIYILTGSEPDEFQRKLAKFGNSVDVFGGGDTHTVDFFVKEDLDKLIEDVTVLAHQCNHTNAVDLNFQGRNLDLGSRFERILRIFIRRAGGDSAVIVPLGGGLSGSRVLHLTVKNQQDKVLAICVAKLDTLEKAKVEMEAYQRHVLRLKDGVVPSLKDVVREAIGGMAGIFYGLAEDHDRTFFDVVIADPDSALIVAERVFDGLSRWREATEIVDLTVDQIVLNSVSEQSRDDILKAFSLPWHSSVAALTIRCRQSCVHGDLHGANILVNRENAPVVIDFGDVGEALSCLDPLTLELSLIFHPEAIEKGISDRLISGLDHWDDTDVYSSGDPIQGVIKACRTWAFNTAAREKEVFAVAYSFAFRQLKYDSVDPAHTLRLLERLSQRLLT